MTKYIANLPYLRDDPAEVLVQVFMNDQRVGVLCFASSREWEAFKPTLGPGSEVLEYTYTAI